MINIKKYDSFDNIINNIWRKCKQKIHLKCCKHDRFMDNIKSIWMEIVKIIIRLV
jgi:hypothetical protein